jgi:hypothetical protein
MINSHPTRIHQLTIFGTSAAYVSNVLAKLVELLDSTVDEVCDVDVVF